MGLFRGQDDYAAQIHLGREDSASVCFTRSVEPAVRDLVLVGGFASKMLWNLQDKQGGPRAGYEEQWSQLVRYLRGSSVPTLSLRDDIPKEDRWASARAVLKEQRKGWWVKTPYSPTTPVSALPVATIALAAAVRQRAGSRSREVDVVERRIALLWEDRFGFGNPVGIRVYPALVWFALADYPFSAQVLASVGVGAVSEPSEKALDAITGAPSQPQLAAPPFSP